MDSRACHWQILIVAMKSKTASRQSNMQHLKYSVTRKVSRSLPGFIFVDSGWEENPSHQRYLTHTECNLTEINPLVQLQFAETYDRKVRICLPLDSLCSDIAWSYRHSLVLSRKGNFSKLEHPSLTFVENTEAGVDKWKTWAKSCIPVRNAEFAKRLLSLILLHII